MNLVYENILIDSERISHSITKLEWKYRWEVARIMLLRDQIEVAKYAKTNRYAFNMRANLLGSQIGHEEMSESDTNMSDIGHLGLDGTVRFAAKLNVDKPIREMSGRAGIGPISNLQEYELGNIVEYVR